MKPGSRIPALLRELAEEFDSLLAEEAKPRRTKPVREPPKFALVPNDLQRARADRLMREKGLAK